MVFNLKWSASGKFLTRNSAVKCIVWRKLWKMGNRWKIICNFPRLFTLLSRTRNPDRILNNLPQLIWLKHQEIFPFILFLFLGIVHKLNTRLAGRVKFHIYFKKILFHRKLKKYGKDVINEPFIPPYSPWRKQTVFLHFSFIFSLKWKQSKLITTMFRDFSLFFVHSIF